MDDLDTADGFGRFYEANRRRMEALARGIVGDRQSAEDVVASATIRVWQRFSRGLPDNPAAYFARAVQNEARDHLRRTLRDRALRAKLTPTLSASEHARVDDREMLSRMLGGLTPGQRTALGLRYLEDLSEQDVASSMGIPRGTVKSHAHRGIRRLRQLAG